ncbi:ATP-dependent zinc metalloprotease YME1L-like [Tubulanus polymorphus]|uniref:ATP-dependent zinc metalloprotease YME1L-like n=1 Tax=Tubulanus polymorphus TaxID=672921 RepID=UPI003DA5FE4B
MFSLTNQPQILLPVGALSQLLNSRAAASNVPQARKSSVNKQRQKQIETKRVLDCLSSLGIDNVDSLSNVTELAVDHNVSNLRHTSSQNFFKNKNGFDEKELKVAVLSDPYPKLWWTQTLFKQLVTATAQFQPSRGFKTKRSGKSGLGTKQSDDVQDESIGNIIRNSVWDRDATKLKETDQFKSMLSELETAPHLQDKLKIAFAEGYAINKKKDTSGIRSPLVQRLMKAFLYGLAFWCIIQIIQLFSTVGGGMRGVGLLQREQYEINPEEISVCFDDVKGVDEAKQELQDVVEFLKDPEKFTSLGAKLPKGVLLVGPPGIGKTLLARAVAGEAGVPFFHASGSEFDEIFVGTGAKRVRQLFTAAKVRAPCVIFIDEIDTVGAKRTSSQIHPYANQTINQLLSEMDGFQQNEGVVVLGATNRRDNLDKAILRPGRFDVEVRVYPPDLKGRIEIIKLYLTKVKVDANLDVEQIARGTAGFTGADIENMVNQAALKAAMDESTVVRQEHIDFARDKVLMGPAKKTRIPDEEINLLTAYHEAGHTLVAYFTKDATPLHKVTIIPRGMSLGHTAFVPEKEEYNKTKAQLLAAMDVAMGGRVAEELIYGSEKVTTGASSDFQQATKIATAMVKRFGMSEKVGVRVFEDEGTDTGLSMLKVNDVGPATTELVDTEIKRILQESYERAKNILKLHTNEHKMLAKALMKYETLDKEDITAIVEGRKTSKAQDIM